MPSATYCGKKLGKQGTTNASAFSAISRLRQKIEVWRTFLPRSAQSSQQQSGKRGIEARRRNVGQSSCRLAWLWRTDAVLYAFCPSASARHRRACVQGTCACMRRGCSMQRARGRGLHRLHVHDAPPQECHSSRSTRRSELISKIHAAGGLMGNDHILSLHTGDALLPPSRAMVAA